MPIPSDTNTSEEMLAGSTDVRRLSHQSGSRVGSALHETLTFAWFSLSAQRLAAVLRPEAFQNAPTGALPQEGKEGAPNDHVISEEGAFTVAVMYQRLVS
jgi:hypothetical protein